MPAFHSLAWIADRATLRLLDQRLLPSETVYRECASASAVAEAIRTMVVRGAPAIGASAAYGLALTLCHDAPPDLATAHSVLRADAEILRAARPTAVNLGWALERLLARAADPTLTTVPALRDALLAEAHAIAADDVAINRRMGLNAQPLVPNGATIIHHCNTGSLATVDYGTALGVVRMAHELGKHPFVLVDETRPRLQGARLTAWELQQQGIAYQIIVDGASGHFMRTHGVDLCLVGADRVAANGDTANKIGTYNLALVAHAHKVPFYVVAPLSTIDRATPNGDAIAIEERPAREVTHLGEVAIAPVGAPAANPAFDVTLAQYITAIITEAGIAYPPYRESLARIKEEESSTDDTD